MKYLNQIEAYWERRMSREEEEAFEQEIGSNAGLREEMKAYEASLRLLELAALEEPEQKRPARTITRWVGLAAALAALLAVALFAYANLNYSAGRLAKNSYETPIFSDIIRGDSRADSLPRTRFGGGRQTADGKKALAAFATGNYGETINILEAREKNDPALSYLLGHAYYQNGNMDKAAALFSALAQQSGSPYRQGAGWYLALAQLRIGKTDTARQQLKAISQESENPNRQRAADLLSRLESSWRVWVVGK
ncbi:MAG: tetratricopeptide repeat protein [Phaeodactylibacter sp.]|nr:tetratricopeptide repeat protein [Phaeodactylibacter sp.]